MVIILIRFSMVLPLCSVFGVSTKAFGSYQSFHQLPEDFHADMWFCLLIYWTMNYMVTYTMIHGDYASKLLPLHYLLYQPTEHPSSHTISYTHIGLFHSITP